MKCLKCNRDGVSCKNATDVSEGGGSYITCAHCGQKHYYNLAFGGALSLPVSMKTNVLVISAVFALIAVVFGGWKLLAFLLS